jgi:predicted transcriptional regulator
MKDRAKNTLLFIFAILAIVGIAFAFSSFMKSGENRKLFEKEMAFRLDMEEKVSKLRNEKMDLITELKNKELEVQQTQNKEKIISELNQKLDEQNVKIESLQSELGSLKLLKDELEAKLNEASLKGKQ